MKDNWLDAALLDLMIFKLHRVGRKNMTAEELWQSWLEQ